MKPRAFVLVPALLTVLPQLGFAKPKMSELIPAGLDQDLYCKTLESSLRDEWDESLTNPNGPTGVIYLEKGSEYSKIQPDQLRWVADTSNDLIRRIRSNRTLLYKMLGISRGEIRPGALAGPFGTKETDELTEDFQWINCGDGTQKSGKYLNDFFQKVTSDGKLCGASASYQERTVRYRPREITKNGRKIIDPILHVCDIKFSVPFCHDLSIDEVARAVRFEADPSSIKTIRGTYTAAHSSEYTSYIARGMQGSICQDGTPHLYGETLLPPAPAASNSSVDRSCGALQSCLSYRGDTESGSPAANQARP